MARVKRSDWKSISGTKARLLLYSVLLRLETDLMSCISFTFCSVPLDIVDGFVQCPFYCLSVDNNTSFHKTLMGPDPFKNRNSTAVLSSVLQYYTDGLWARMPLFGSICLQLVISHYRLGSGPLHCRHFSSVSYRPFFCRSQLWHFPVPLGPDVLQAWPSLLVYHWIQIVRWVLILRDTLRVSFHNDHW